MKQNHYVRLTGLLLLSVLVAAPAAARYWLWGSSPAGVLSDLLIGSLLLFLLWRRHPAIVLAVLLAWTLVQAGTAETIEAIGRLPELADAGYLTDLAFLGRSIDGGSLILPLYPASLLALSLPACLLAWRSRPFPDRSTRTPPWGWLAVPVALLALHVLALRVEAPAETWKQYNVVHRLAVDMLLGGMAGIHEDDDARRWAAERLAGTVQPDLSGDPLLNGAGLARNVLVVVLEGIPGAYVSQIREARGYAWDQDPMPRLGAFAREQRAMHIPDFVLHSHQTIRGLYSLLCGDYPKLDGSTPKAFELLASSGGRQQYCLPARLARAGFSTHFLQAAGLAFMSKDKVMPRIGFQEVCGDRCLAPGSHKKRFAWGLDDAEFFAASLGHVLRLQRQPQPWLMTLLTVGTHQPYDAPASYRARYPDERMAAVAYLDEVLSRFLQALREAGVLDDTLVIVTSDESHGIGEVRLASAWGLGLVFAPERQALPVLKPGVYGQVDMTASVLDYLGIAPEGVLGRSFFRDYRTGRDILSYTNGLLRVLDRDGVFHECQLPAGCRDYAQSGFISPHPGAGQRSPAALGDRLRSLAGALDRSLSLPANQQVFQFANADRRRLEAHAADDWADNLIGAQYLEFPAGTRTHVSLNVQARKAQRDGVRMRLALKEFDRDSDIVAPELPLLHTGERLVIDFDIDNPVGRKAFSFHLVGTGRGEIQIDEFRITVTRVADGPPVVAVESTDATGLRPAAPDAEDTTDPADAT